MSNLWKNDNDDDIQLSLTPMIDVVFLLVIFFLTGTILKTETESDTKVKIEMPDSGESGDTLASPTPPPAITINAEGKLFPDIGDSVQNNEIAVAKYCKQLKEKGATSLIIRSDRRCKYETPAMVIRVAGDIGLDVLLGYSNSSD